MGLLGFFNPTLALLIALETAFTASSCPISLWWSVSSILRSLTDSVSVNFWTGTPVHEATICATSSSLTRGLCKSFESLFTELSASDWSPAVDSFLLSKTSLIFADNSISFSRNWPAWSKFWSLTDSSFCFWTCLSSLSICFASGGSLEFIKRTLLPASSMRSIALSGKNLSDI